MKSFSSFSFLAAVALGCLLASATGFALRAAIDTTKSRVSQREKTTPLFGFLGPPERDSLTRDTEPEEFFQT